MVLALLLTDQAAYAMQWYDCGGYSWPNPNCPSPPEPPNLQRYTSTIEAYSPSTLSYIDCQPHLDTGAANGGGITWRAYLICTGKPTPGTMSGQYADSNAVQSGPPVSGTTASCGNGAYSPAGIQWMSPPAFPCAPDTGVMSYPIPDCTSCHGGWQVEGRFVMVFPITYGITTLSDSTSCKLQPTNVAYCDIYAYVSVS